MKKSIIKFVSLFFALSLVFAVTIPAFATSEAETFYDEYTDEDVFQEYTDVNDIQGFTYEDEDIREFNETITAEVYTSSVTASPDADASAKSGAKTNIAKKLIISLVIGLLIGLIVASVLKSSLKSVGRQAGASNYIEDGSFNLSGKEDVFLYKKEERTPIPKQEPPKK